MKRIIGILLAYVLLVGCGGKKQEAVYTELNVDSMPELVSMPAPEYPQAAKDAGMEGLVYIRAEVMPNGKVIAAEIGQSSGHPELDAAAVSAVLGAVFKPAIADGKPVPVWVGVPVRFDAGEPAFPPKVTQAGGGTTIMP